jgi:hypothetical protein
MRDFNNGALDMEALANVRICQDMLGYHLCFATRDRHFHEAFGISSKSTFILWTLLNVPNEVPEGGKQVHLLWVLLVLKTYNTQHDLAGRCGVCKDTFKAWQDLFLEQIASLGDKELVSIVLVLLLYLTFLILLPHLLAIRLTLKTDTWMLIQTKSVKSWWM